MQDGIETRPVRTVVVGIAYPSFLCSCETRTHLTEYLGICTGLSPVHALKPTHISPKSYDNDFGVKGRG